MIHLFYWSKKALLKYNKGNNMKYVIIVTAVIVVFGLIGCSSEQMEQGVAVKVSEGDLNTVLSYYNTTPENPDGSKIVYTKFLSNPENERGEKVPAEIWVCNSDLTNHRKVVSINDIAVHNGARVQWLDNTSFAYQDDSIRAVDLNGKALMKPVSGRIGHETYKGKILFSGSAKEPGLSDLSTIYEYDVANKQLKKLADVTDFQEVYELYHDTNLRALSEVILLHLQYSPNGEKVAFRLDIGPKNEKYRHLISMNYDGSKIKYFGPKPMHFSWFDNSSLQGHDNQIDDGLPNDKSGRVWDLERNVIETLSGPGNHFAASYDKKYIASESWYGENPVVLSVFKRGQNQPFWQDTISTDSHSTWTLANHANPSFSRDGKRVYYNKCLAPGKVFVYFVKLPQ
jgi:hypothetical protein